MNEESGPLASADERKGLSLRTNRLKFKASGKNTHHLKRNLWNIPQTNKRNTKRSQHAIGWDLKTLRFLTDCAQNPSRIIDRLFIEGLQFFIAQCNVSGLLHFFFFFFLRFCG